MANERRVRTNFVGGLIEDNPLALAATTLTSAGLASAPAIGSTEHWPIILDPDGRAGNPEIAYITAHTAGAQTATITKAQEGTTGRAHDRDTPWIHGPTIKDFDGFGGGSGLIGITAYAPGSDSAILNAGTSTTLVAADATNLTVAFTAPPSGKVLVRLSALANVSVNGTAGYWGLLDAVNAQVGKTQYVTALSSVSSVRYAATLWVTGLTAGTAYVHKWAYKVSANNMSIYGGPGYGDAVMEVWAVNL